MRTILFESISLNGMIARADGRGDFFSDYCWSGFCEIARRTGAMVWGRATHAPQAALEKLERLGADETLVVGGPTVNHVPGHDVTGAIDPRFT